jgi:hypothetical protein
MTATNPHLGSSTGRLRRSGCRAGRVAMPGGDNENMALRYYLVVINQTPGGEEQVELMRAIRARTATGPCRFHLLVNLNRPGDVYESVTAAYAGDRLDDNEAVTAARRVLQNLLGLLREAGAQVEGQIGGLNPLKTIRAASSRRRFDGIILCTPPPGISRWFRRDLLRRVEQACGLPVIYVPVRWMRPTRRPSGE